MSTQSYHRAVMPVPTTNIYFRFGMESNEGFDPVCGLMPRKTGCAGWNLSRDPAREG
jgi:hypothetical protein